MVAKHPGHRIGICPQSLRTHNRRAMPTDPPATASARLFLALWPPSEVLDAALRHAAQWSWPRGARRVRPDKVHMTLHFLGAVPRDHIDALVDALAVPFA